MVEHGEMKRLKVMVMAFFHSDPKPDFGLEVENEEN